MLEVKHDNDFSQSFRLYFKIAKVLRISILERKKSKELKQESLSLLNALFSTLLGSPMLLLFNICKLSKSKLNKWTN